jgi:hypothetical protein
LSLSEFLSSQNSPRNYRSDHANEMAKLAQIESESSNCEPVPEVPILKPPASKLQTVSPAVVKTASVPPPSKKGLVMHSLDIRFIFTIL